MIGYNTKTYMQTVKYLSEVERNVLCPCSEST